MDKEQCISYIERHGIDAWNFWRREHSDEQIDLKNIDLSGRTLENVHFYRADLSGANLNACDLTDANLSAALLHGADMRNTSLVRADLSNADLSGVDLSDADMRGANLTEANLSGAKLNRADLTDTNLLDARVQAEQLRLARSVWRLTQRALCWPARTTSATLSYSSKSQLRAAQRRRGLDPANPPTAATDAAPLFVTFYTFASGQ